MSVKVVQHLVSEGRWIDEEKGYEHQNIVTTIVRSPIDVGIRKPLSPHEMEEILRDYLASL